MTVRVRGIYATALTELLSDIGVVQPSGPIEERFETDFSHGRALATVETTDDRQGVGVVGERETVAAVRERLESVGRDALAWGDPTPRGAVYAGEVTETLGGGAVVDLGDDEGYLPFAATSDRIETGDRLRVQVRDPAAPWGDDRPRLDTSIRVQGSLATLIRGGSSNATNGPAMTDILPTDPREGWAVSWDRASEEADLDALSASLSALNERAALLDDALTEAPADAAPHRIADGEGTVWVWFGRESRFELDAVRREVTTTMPGHHRTKAGSNSASAAVDLVEALTEDVDVGETDFPFAVVAEHFGPRPGDTVSLDHGKPDGRMYTLGDADVESVQADGTVTIEREMSPGGTYDGLGVERRAGDVATTKVREGRWWYPTVYESAQGERRGTYVNVCTPVEVFPGSVRYVDLHVDVVKHADGTVERVDDDELDDAVAAGHISEELAEKARSVASAVEHALD